MLGTGHTLTDRKWQEKDFRIATHTKTWSCRGMRVNWGWLAVLEALRAERCLILEVRAGSAATGCTTQDATVFSSTDRNGNSVAWSAQWRADCDLCSETEIWI